LRRPGQLTKGDRLRQSNRSVWSAFRPDVSEGAWQRPSSCVLGAHSIGWFMPLIAQHRLGAHCGWEARRGGRCPPRTPLVAEHCKGSERYGHLNDDRAEREQPDFSLGLRIHGSPNAQRHGSFQGSAGIEYRSNGDSDRTPLVAGYRSSLDSSFSQSQRHP
jgi:hypothetical protein